MNDQKKEELSIEDIRAFIETYQYEDEGKIIKYDMEGWKATPKLRRALEIIDELTSQFSRSEAERIAGLDRVMERAWEEAETTSFRSETGLTDELCTGIRLRDLQTIIDSEKAR